MMEFWKWIAGATLVVFVSVTGVFFAMAGDHGERLARVEQAIVSLGKIAEQNQLWHLMHGHPGNHEEEGQ